MTTEFVPRKGDRIVFFGDSITEQQMYSNYVETYLSSRYPELGMTFFNAGWGGDTAPGGAARMDRDVLALQPTLVTLCFGMNDGGYTQPTEKIRTTYVAGMEELIRRFKEKGVRIVLMTPGMADEDVAPNLAAVAYNRKGLRVLADEVLKLAAREHLPVVDTHRLMNEVSAKAKAVDPAFTMIPDGFHPDPAGHLVMAFGLLQALGVPPRNEKVAVDLAAKSVKTSAGVSARGLRKNAYGFTLSLELATLPFYVEQGARKVLPFLPFHETFNELHFSVHGLTAPRGYFRSSAFRSESMLREAFESGVNLFTQAAIEPVMHAEMLHRFTLEKDQIFFKAWRALGLNGLNSPYYNPAAHKAGIRSMTLLEQGRRKITQSRARLKFSLNVVATDLPGEPVQDGEFISQWNFLGPFPRDLALPPFGTEKAFSASVPALDKKWIATDLVLTEPGNNLALVFGGGQQNCCAYAVTMIRSPIAQNVELLIGSDDGVGVWLNGEQKLDNLAVNRGLAVDQDRVSVSLRAGENVLLVKVTQGMGSWGLCVRLSGLRKPVAAIRPKPG